MWQAEADIELTLSALPAAALGQLTLTLTNWRYSTVLGQVFRIVTRKPNFKQPLPAKSAHLTA